MIEIYKLRTLDDKPVFLKGGSKILEFNFNIDTQETEVAVENSG